jgi:hypothetical protein
VVVSTYPSIFIHVTYIYFRWQDEVREDVRLVGEKGWKERVYNRGMEEALRMQGMVSFCTCQWNELTHIYLLGVSPSGELQNYEYLMYTHTSVISPLKSFV